MYFSIATIILSSLASLAIASPIQSRDQFWLQSPGYFRMYGFGTTNGAAVCNHLPKPAGSTVRLHPDLMGPTGTEACGKEVTIFYYPQTANIYTDSAAGLASAVATVYGKCVDSSCQSTSDLEVSGDLFQDIYKNGDTVKGVWPGAAMVAGPSATVSPSLS